MFATDFFLRREVPCLKVVVVGVADILPVIMVVKRGFIELMETQWMDPFGRLLTFK